MNNKGEYLQFPMKLLVILSVVTSVIVFMYWFTNNYLLLVSSVCLVVLLILTYLYITIHIIYKYYWFFNGGKILEERNLDMGFVTRSSIVTIFMIIFAFISLFSLVSLTQAGNALLEYLPEEYASMIFGFSPALVFALCIFCLVFVFLFLYVQKAIKQNINVLKIEINCNRAIIFSFLIHYLLSISYYINKVVPFLKNSDISITTNNLFILSLAAIELKAIVILILTNLENEQYIESNSK